MGITVNIMNLLKRKPAGPRPTGKVIIAKEHKGWGNSIVIDDFRAGKIYGHLPFYLQVGDEIRFDMQSGRVGRTLVSSVKQMSDPPDMFFATFFPLGYLDD